MSDPQQEQPANSSKQMPQPEEIIEIPTTSCNKTTADENVCEIRSQNIKNGHTFVVTTVRSETITQTRAQCQQVNQIETCASAIISADEPCTSSEANAVVPLSSSLPSKLLRFHARRSAQNSSHMQSNPEPLPLQSQTQSLDSQFGSDEGVNAGDQSEDNSDDAYDEPRSPSPTAPPMSPPPPRNSPSADNSSEEKIDVGMGSSIEGSEESEEDDELKPLAIDNHVLHQDQVDGASTSALCATQANNSSADTAVLSEANLEKFRKHHNGSQYQHPHMDNIYLHPNFKYELDVNGGSAETTVLPPPSAEQKRIHRSFLNIKKSETIVERAYSAASQATTVTADDKTVINEIDSLEPALVPSEELASEITDAVEFYFSNDSILKDAFLLKHVRRNKEGFVSLKLVSSFKRVRQLTKDWKVVGNAVRRKSRKIELNDVGTKVRRVEPLPNFDETMPSRTIVACDLPLDKLSIEKVSDIFSKCGEIALIRILKPGMAIPVDVRQFMNKYPEMQQKECALVEYLESSSAREALYLQGPFKVFEMVAPKKKTGKKAVIQLAAPVVRMVENYRYFNDHSHERTRGGSFSGMVPQDVDLRYKLKRNNSDFAARLYATDMHHVYAGAVPSSNYHHHHHHHQTQYNPTQRGSFGSDHHQMHQQHYQPRGSIGQETVPPSSPGTNGNYFAYNPRRYSNTSTVSAGTAGHSNSNLMESTANHYKPSQTINTNLNTASSSSLQRRLSNCSQEGSYSEALRRSSNCSDNVPPQRRDSNCSDNCPCSRRVSDFGQTEVYRKTSQGSIGSNGGSGGERRFSNGSLQFERTFSNPNDMGSGSNFHRRMSNEFSSGERKHSVDAQSSNNYEEPPVGGGGGGYNVFPRRYSNTFNNVSSKLAQYDNAQYINGRRISTDSGYDRRCSFGSEYEGSPRSRTNSFLNNYKYGGGDYDAQSRSRTNSFLDGSPRSRSGSFAQRTAEHLVRTPIGPDGSKGFGSRGPAGRKMEHSITAV